MNERDLLVAFISIGLGVSIFYTMLMNAEWCFRLKTPQMLERNFGRNGAKLVMGTVATLLIVVGLHLIFTPMLSRGIAAKTIGKRSINHPSGELQLLLPLVRQG